MSTFSAAQIEELTRKLSGALNEIDLGRFVHISTGDRLEVY